MLLSLIQWLEKNQLPCFYKKYLGIHCPGCGMQGAFILLLKGDIAGSLSAYPPLIPIMLLLLGLLTQLIFKFEKGGIYLRNLFIFTVLITLIHFIIRFFI
jgi:hypothetical protein